MLGANPGPGCGAAHQNMCPAWKGVPSNGLAVPNLAELWKRTVDPQKRVTSAEACELEVFKANAAMVVELPPMVDLQEAPPLPEEAPPPLPPDAPPCRAKGAVEAEIMIGPVVLNSDIEMITEQACAILTLKPQQVPMSVKRTAAAGVNGAALIPFLIVALGHICSRFNTAAEASNGHLENPLQEHKQLQDAKIQAQEQKIEEKMVGIKNHLQEHKQLQDTKIEAQERKIEAKVVGMEKKMTELHNKIAELESTQHSGCIIL
eukprot:Skav210996  [mRNA]  locus=scaffold2325:145748:150890:+ [translate_table: standard]